MCGKARLAPRCARLPYWFAVSGSWRTTGTFPTADHGRPLLPCEGLCITFCRAIQITTDNYIAIDSESHSTTCKYFYADSETATFWHDTGRDLFYCGKHPKKLYDLDSGRCLVSNQKQPKSSLQICHIVPSETTQFTVRTSRFMSKYTVINSNIRWIGMGRCGMYAP